MCILCAPALVGPAFADKSPSLEQVAQAAGSLFSDLPKLSTVPLIEGRCGADAHTHPFMAYCTSTNSILVLQDRQDDPKSGYELAHLMGHAVQVRHGVADIALREILSRRSEEAKLRAWVTQQVECIAGFIYGAAGGQSFELSALYSTEPFTGSHWGRNPLAKGPKVSVGMAARQEWFDIGLNGDLSACAPGEFGSELLLEALIPTQ